MGCPVRQKFTDLAGAFAAAAQCRAEGRHWYVEHDPEESNGVKDVFVLVKGSSPMIPTHNEYASYQNALAAARRIGGSVQTLCADEVPLCVHSVVKR